MRGVAYATTDELEACWRILTPRETQVAAALLEQAAARLDEHASTDDETLLGIASLEMVRHALAPGPDAFGLDMGDYNSEQGWSAEAAPGDMWLTGDTKDLVGWDAPCIGSIGYSVDEG